MAPNIEYQNQSTPQRRICPFDEEETKSIQKRLDSKLDAEHISYRPSQQGTVAYLEGWRSLHLANEAFGFNGWSSEILMLTTDFVDCDPNGRVTLGMSCIDIGYGSAENQRSKAAAYEKARKEAVTDAMKRALRVFGSRLGNCAYDKAFLRHIKTAPRQPFATPTSNPNADNPPGFRGGQQNAVMPLSENIPPANFVPCWTRPKMTNAPPTGGEVAACEEENEPIFTEERILPISLFVTIIAY